MKPYALTENRPLGINELSSEPKSSFEEAEQEQEQHQEIAYPRELSKQGLLLSVGISAAVVTLLLIVIV
ncbi:MAG: hypothetical protein PVG50_00300 [Thiohalophilus sp.]